MQFFVNHGFAHGVRLLARRFTRRLLRRPSTEPQLATPFDLYPRQTPPAIHPFDQLYNVDTSGFHHGADLGGTTSVAGDPAGPGSLPSERATPLPDPPAIRQSFGAAVWNTAYYGIAPSIFDRALALARPADLAAPPPDWSRFTFVDLGCGKGRALLLASRHPFLGILGVELDPGLAAIAQHNLRAFHAPWQLCHHIEILHADATTADLPRTPILLYLYHPFLAPALRQVLRRLELSLRRHPRELWLVYINPEALGVLAAFPFLKRVAHATVPLHPDDALPDRLGSTAEELVVFHSAPTP